MHKIEGAFLAAMYCLTLGGAVAADLEAGRGKAEQCEACHGLRGVSENPTVPSLAGQQDRFLQWQLVFFRSGRRANEIMGPIAAGLTDEDIRNLGAYYTSLPPGGVPASDSDPTMRQRGQQVAEQNRCAACHGSDFSGSRAAPSIKHQPREYLAKALSDYRGNARPSTGVAAMTEAAAPLSDEDIQSLAYFLEAHE